jgi:hypothetical protein
MAFPLILRLQQTLELSRTDLPSHDLEIWNPKDASPPQERAQLFTHTTLGRFETYDSMIYSIENQLRFVQEGRKSRAMVVSTL